MDARWHLRHWPIGAASVAVLASWTLEPLFRGSYTFLIFVPAVVLGAVLGGLIPALIAVALSTVIGLLHIYLATDGALTPVIYLHAVTFLICGLVISWTGEKAHRLRADLVSSLATSRLLLRRAQSSTAELRSQTDQLNFALDVGHLGAFQYDAESDRLSGNERFWLNFGLERAGARSLATLQNAAHAGDRQALMACLDPNQPVRGERIERDIRIVGRDGAVRWINLRCRPETVDDKRVIAGISMDVTERRQADAAEMLATRNKLVIGELLHRIQNLFPVINSIVRLTAQFAPSVAAYQHDLSERLRVLETTYYLLAGDVDRAATVEDLVRIELAPYDDDERVRYEGESVLLKEGAAESFAMIIHELTTNSIKYGALGHADAQLSVQWHTESSGDPRRLTFEWRESGGPRPNASGRKGYGSSIIGAAGPPIVGQDARMEFTDDGLNYSLVIPLDQPDDDADRTSSHKTPAPRERPIAIRAVGGL